MKQVLPLALVVLLAAWWLGGQTHGPSVAPDAPQEEPTATPVSVVIAPYIARNVEPTPPYPTFTPTPLPPTATPTPIPTFDPARTTIRLDPVAGGLSEPIGVAHAGDGSGRLFVVEKAGVIRIVRGGAVDPTPFLDIHTLVLSSGYEQGLLGLAFHPRYRDTGLFYVNYINRQGNTVVARYQVSADPNRADPGSAKILLTVTQPYANHNGGQLAFGPDGYLYIGLGDGGSGGDPQGNGQKPSTLLGKILRIDVDQGDPYAIPPDNPFRDRSGYRPEIWALGLRNPWRFSFDRQTGDLFIGDVGQDVWEEVDFQPAGSPGGENYGWNRMEGTHCYPPSRTTCDMAGLTLPIFEYRHTAGACSVTGGYVYRGAAYPTLTGAYLVADFCNGQFWALSRADGRWLSTPLVDADIQVTSFGEDEAGEVYVVGSGGLYRVAAVAR